MNKQKEKISKFSKALCTVISVTFVVFIVIGILQVLSWVITIWDLPHVFTIGDTRVILPVILTNSIKIGDTNLIIPGFVKGNLVGITQTIVTLIILSFTKSFFKLLCDDGTPFRTDVVKALRKTAIAIVVLALFTGVEGWIAAGVVYVLYLIFEYGCTLQNEIDTTL